MKENSVDVWDAFLNTLENRGVSSSWEVAPEVQEKLTNYFKTKINIGVVDGKTALPSDLIWNEYVWRFPDEDAAVLREFITEKEIPWRQILDSEGFGGPFAKRYGIRGIPAPFLIDREGKVISVKARGSLLDELVASEIAAKKS